MKFKYEIERETEESMGGGKTVSFNAGALREYHDWEELSSLIQMIMSFEGKRDTPVYPELIKDWMSEFKSKIKNFNIYFENNEVYFGSNKNNRIIVIE